MTFKEKIEEILKSNIIYSQDTGNYDGFYTDDACKEITEELVKVLEDIKKWAIVEALHIGRLCVPVTDIDAKIKELRG